MQKAKLKYWINFNNFGQIEFFNMKKIFNKKQIPENTRRVFSGISVGNRAGREMLGQKFSGIG